jgi:hypothetical protein
MASSTRPFWMTSWIAIGLTLLLASAHISPVAGYAPSQSVTSYIISSRATSLPGFDPRRAYAGGLPATLFTSILARDEEGENGMEDDGGEAEPNDDVRPQSDEGDSNSDALNTCASENAEIERLTQDLAHCNLYQKPQGDQAIELLTAERDDFLEKLAWMTRERDREHKLHERVQVRS